jgi:SAM-dependent methyltransferase
MENQKMFNELDKINNRPELFSISTIQELWTDPYTEKKMLEIHLDPNVELGARPLLVPKSVKWMIEHFKINEKTKVCDFGCGPGLHTDLLAETGADVTGIDFSANSINYARDVAEKKNLNINYFCEDYLKFSTDKKFDLIIMVGGDISPLNPEKRKQLLEQFSRFLTDDGHLLLTAYSHFLFDTTVEKSTYEYSGNNGFWSNDPYYVFNNTFKYDNGDEKVYLDKYTIIEEKRTREIYNWMQCYDLEYFTKILNENNFNVVENYLNVAGDPFHEKGISFAVVAKKII